MRFMMKELNRFEDEMTSRMSCCATASSISSSHIHRDRRHPRRRLAYVAAVAIMGLAAETVLLHLTQLSHPPGSYADVSRAPPSADVSAVPPGVC